MPLLLHIAAGRPPHASLFELSYRELSSDYRAAVDRCGVQVLQSTLYCLRHGGASHDRWSGSRPLLEVQQRGAWRATSSVLRYDKHGRLGLQLQRLGCEVRRRLERETCGFELAFTRLFWANCGAAAE